MIPQIDAEALAAGDPQTRDRMAEAAREVGFLTVVNTALSPARVNEVLESYRAFFLQPLAVKAAVDMAQTGASRGWGGPQSEQVDPEANPGFQGSVRLRL